MKTLYSRLALITSVTLITGYLIVSAVWTDMGSVGAGNQLTADLWNTFVDNLNDLDTRLKSTASTWPTVTGGIAYTGGNVGIGTITPGKKLDVAGHIRWGASGEGVLTYDGTNTYIDAALAGGATNFRNNIGTVVMKLQSDGNVGIGTANPGGYRTAIRGSTDDNTASALWVSGAASLTGALVVRNDGNVGIGTTTPGARLEVTGAANAYTAIFQSSLTASQAYGPMIHAGTNSTDTAFTVNDATNTNPLFRVRGDGNVGIGTASPGGILEVAGNGAKEVILNDTDGGGGGDLSLVLSNNGTKKYYMRNRDGLDFEISRYGTSQDFYLKNGNAAFGAVPTGTKLKITQTTDSQWTAHIDGASPTVGQNYGLTVRAGTNSSDISFNVMDKTSTNYYLHVRGDGNVGIGTGVPGSYKLKVDGGPLGVYHSQNTNSVLQVVGKDAPSSATFLAVMASGNGADNEFLFQSDGTAKADGTWNGGGADYAEWFEKEGEIIGGALIGLNAETGKVRTWQKGDIFMGVQSLNPGFIGNNIHGAETKESDMVKTHVLVALVGQVEVRSKDIIEEGRRIMTSDGQFIGLRLSNGNVFIK